MVANTFEYGLTRVGGVQVDRVAHPEKAGAHVTLMRVNGEPMVPTRRFWRSFFNRFGITENVFRYFTHQEVFGRISDASENDTLRFCVERSEDGAPRLLAVTNPSRTFIDHDRMRDLLDRHGVESVDYDQGIITSRHVPRSGLRGVQIGPDLFHNRFSMETPIDGFGQPRIFLSLLREVCSNGAIGYSRAFRSDIRVGEDYAHTIDRALNHFDHGEGYAALHQRFQSAQNSWASIHEARRLERTLLRAYGLRSIARQDAFESFGKLTGDLRGIYGLANIDALSSKRQRVLPTRARVYDLINFASELATHHATPAATRQLQAYVGTIISDEYDLEGTAEETPEFQDLFVTAN